MKFEELIEFVIECLNTFKPDIDGPDSHAENVMRKVIK